MSTDTRLMFLTSERFEKGNTLRGAFLITDDKTIPLEFRCTQPVQPTDLQKILYGHILEQYVLVELLAMPLIQAAREKPDLILVRNPFFLELRPKIEIPVLCLLKETEGRRHKNIETRLLFDQRDRMDIILTTAGPSKEAVIQALSKIQGLKFQPHQIIGHLPYTIGKNVSKETAQKIRILLEKAGAAVKLTPSIQKTTFSTQIIQNDQILHSESGRFESLILITHRDFADERSQQRVLLNQIFKQYNLIEPFDRIAAALRQVHAQNLDTRSLSV